MVNWNMSWSLPAWAVDALYLLVDCLLKLAGGQALEQSSRYR